MKTLLGGELEKGDLAYSRDRSMTTKKRGFASMDPQKQREIASKGGRAAHQKGTAHEFTPEEAREAGRKGGQAAHSRGTAHKFTSEEAREAGRKGGRSVRGNTISNTNPSLNPANANTTPLAVEMNAPVNPACPINP
jgi:general stress protein YciG